MLWFWRTPCCTWGGGCALCCGRLFSQGYLWARRPRPRHPHYDLRCHGQTFARGCAVCFRNLGERVGRGWGPRRWFGRVPHGRESACWLFPAGSHAQPEASGVAAGDPAEIATLRARLAALEGQSAAAAPKAVASAAPGGILRRGARDLFPATGADADPGLTEADWKKLRAAAGQSPGRLAAHEREGRASRVEDGLLAEAEAGAVDEELAALELGAAGQDPLQRLLLVQTQPLARLAPKAPADPITAALGSGGGSGKDEGTWLERPSREY